LFPNQPYFIHQYGSPFRNAYRDSMTLDFYIYHPTKYPDGLILECKFQDGGGTVDEKLHFTVASLKGTGKPSFLLLMGEGFRTSAVQYCLDKQTARFRVLTSWDQFVRMFNTGPL
jgi:hypothetical protein